MPITQGAGEPPSCEWVSRNHLNGPSDVVWEVTTFDDGSGLALYAGGRFKTIGGDLIESVARWDGTSWQQVGSNLRGEVSALVAFDDGGGLALYAGGNLWGEDGDNDIRGVARWDGTSWRALGEGVNNTVVRLLVHDDGSGPALYAGGWIVTAGGQAANNVAKWDGAEWSALGDGTRFLVNGLASFDDGNGADLYAAGWFTNSGGDADGTRYLARWDGTSWSEVSPEIVGNSEAMVVYDDGNGPALYVAALFEIGGELIGDSIAKWDGTSWTPIAEFDSFISRLRVLDDGFGDKLYIGGFFEQSAEGQDLTRLAVWNGSTLEPMGAGFNDGVVALAAYNDGAGSRLVAAGHFERSGDTVANRIARWNGWSWQPFGRSGTANGLGYPPYAAVTFDDGRGPALYAGGLFESAGTVPANHIARWDGSAWEALGSGTDNMVEALAVFDDGDGPTLYAAGRFTHAGAQNANYIAKWDGSSWSPLASGTGGIVRDLAVFDDGGAPALYVGGSFQTADGSVAERIARWDGTSWSTVGSGFDDTVWSLQVYDDGNGPALYAAGDFENAGGVQAAHIAKWDGTSWSAVGLGFTQTGRPRIEDMEAFDDGSGSSLYIAGDFSEVGGVPMDRIARWDGTSWSAAAPDLSGSVFGLTVFNDGQDSALYASGLINAPTPFTHWGLVKKVGETWQPIENSRVNSTVSTVGIYQRGDGPSLIVGGSFTTVDGQASSHWGEYSCADVFIFTDGFESGDLSAWTTTSP